MPVKTIHLKVKSEAWPWLNRAAIEVNQVWNYCNETALKALEPGTERPNGEWLSGFDLANLTSGMTHYFDHISSNSINEVCLKYAKGRRQHKKRSLKWRVSFGPNKNLGWIPFKLCDVKMKGGRARFSGKTFRLFNPEYLLAYGSRCAGCFSENSLGEWFLNIAVEIPETESKPTGKSIGIDLGLKTAVTCSDGSTLESRFYRAMEPRISQAQRRGHKKQSKRLHLKAKNQRLDALHKFSRKLVDENDLIVIGDVRSSGIKKTNMAKAVSDSSWFMLKTFLQYKGDYAGRKVEVVNEAYTTLACGSCGALTGPRGMKGLAVREWTCGDCGASHDRDINAARNILALRQERPLAGTKGSPMAAEVMLLVNSYSLPLS